MTDVGEHWKCEKKWKSFLNSLSLSFSLFLSLSLSLPLSLFRVSLLQNVYSWTFDLFALSQISIFRPAIIIHGSAGGFVKAYKCILHPMIRRVRLWINGPDCSYTGCSSRIASSMFHLIWSWSAGFAIFMLLTQVHRSSESISERDTSLAKILRSLCPFFGLLLLCVFFSSFQSLPQ